MKFYDIYDALAYMASNRCPAFRQFKPALILPKGDGNIVYGMKSGKMAFFFKRCYANGRELTLPVIDISPLKCLPSGLPRHDQIMNLESHLSIDAQANFVETLHEIEERREKLLLCDVGYGNNVVDVMMPGETIEEMLIKWQLEK